MKEKVHQLPAWFLIGIGVLQVLLGLMIGLILGTMVGFALGLRIEILELKEELAAAQDIFDPFDLIPDSVSFTELELLIPTILGLFALVLGVLGLVMGSTLRSQGFSLLQSLVLSLSLSLGLGMGVLLVLSLVEVLGILEWVITLVGLLFMFGMALLGMKDVISQEHVQKWALGLLWLLLMFGIVFTFLVLAITSIGFLLFF